MDDQLPPAFPAPSADQIPPVSCGGDPERARRWALGGRFVWVGGLVLPFGAQVEQDNTAVASLLVAGALSGIALGFWVASRQRRYAPAPRTTGVELARYKAAIAKPGGNGIDIWLVLTDDGVYLLGRGLTTDNQAVGYSDLCCAQRFQLRLLGRTTRALVWLLGFDERGCLVSMRRRDADPILSLLGAHGVLIHPDTDSVGALAFGFGSGKPFDLAKHQSCRTRSPQWLTDPAKRHQFRYWDGVNWTNYVSDDGLVATDELSGHLRDVQPESPSN